MSGLYLSDGGGGGGGGVNYYLLSWLNTGEIKHF